MHALFPAPAGQAACREARLPSSDGASPQWRNREHAFLGAVGRQPLGYPSIRLRTLGSGQPGQQALIESCRRTLSSREETASERPVWAQTVRSHAASLARPFGAFPMARMATFAGEMPFFCRSKAAVRRLQHGFSQSPSGYFSRPQGFAGRCPIRQATPAEFRKLRHVNRTHLLPRSGRD